MNRWMIASLTLLSVAAVTAAPRDNPPDDSTGWASMIAAADLMAEPGGTRLTGLPAGTRVQILDRREGWMKVSVTGWVPVSATGAIELPAGKVAGSLSGSLFVTGARGRTFVGAGTAILLVRDPAAAMEAARPVRASCEPERNRLQQEADSFTEQAARAIRTIENTTKAFAAADEAKRQRARRLTELTAVEEGCEAREAVAMAPFIVARALTTIEGRFSLRDVPPGRYILMTSFAADRSRHTWEVEVETVSGIEGTLDLTNGNRTGQSKVEDHR